MIESLPRFKPNRSPVIATGADGKEHWYSSQYVAAFACSVSRTSIRKALETGGLAGGKR